MGLKRCMGSTFFILLSIINFTNLFAASKEEPLLPMINVGENYIISPLVSAVEEFVPLPNNEAIIILNDYSRWIVNNFVSEECQLDQEYFWKRGDEINLVADAHLGSFILKNLRTNKAYSVHFDINSLEDISTHTIEKINADGYFVVSYNQINWEIFWTRSWIYCFWSPNDRILISRGNCSDENYYLLINLRTKEAVEAKTILKWK